MLAAAVVLLGSAASAAAAVAVLQVPAVLLVGVVPVPVPHEPQVPGRAPPVLVQAQVNAVGGATGASADVRQSTPLTGPTTLGGVTFNYPDVEVNAPLVAGINLLEVRLLVNGNVAATDQVSVSHQPPPPPLRAQHGSHDVVVGQHLRARELVGGIG